MKDTRKRNIANFTITIIEQSFYKFCLDLYDKVKNNKL